MRGRKTGGRNFTKRDPRAGRKKGSKDKVPRGFKQSIRLLYEQLAKEEPNLFRGALVRGLKASAPKSFPYLQMGAHYLDGKPMETVKVIDPTKLKEETIRQVIKDLEETDARPAGA